MLVKTVKEFNIVKLEIVGYLDNRDRLGHLWVAEMLLNAQAKLLIIKLINRINEFKVILAYSIIYVYK